jgi:hypothetical protein
MKYSPTCSPLGYRTATQYGVYYTIPAGGGFRVTGPRTGGWVLGHGTGLNDGYIPNDGRFYNC